jgi:hypothetical protein
MEQDIDQERYRLKKNNITLEKKTFTEQIARLEQKDKAWLEPLKNWIKEPQTLKEIISSPSLIAKKSAALKIFGSNLFLKNKKIEFTPQTQWAALASAIENKENLSTSCLLVGWEGIEPSTLCLKGRCSTTELPSQVEIKAKLVYRFLEDFSSLLFPKLTPEAFVDIY